MNEGQWWWVYDYIIIIVEQELKVILGTLTDKVVGPESSELPNDTWAFDTMLFLAVVDDESSRVLRFLVSGALISSPFVTELSTAEVVSFCSVLILLYFLTPSMLRCPSNDNIGQGVVK